MRLFFLHRPKVATCAERVCVEHVSVPANGEITYTVKLARPTLREVTRISIPSGYSDFEINRVGVSFRHHGLSTYRCHPFEPSMPALAFLEQLDWRELCPELVDFFARLGKRQFTELHLVVRNRHPKPLDFVAFWQLQ